MQDPGCPRHRFISSSPRSGSKTGFCHSDGDDAEGMANSINDRGQVVGTSGSCAAFNPIFLYNFQPLHALLWQNGTATDLGTLGGVFNNFAEEINNRGEVVGGSDVSGDSTSHGFLWTPETKKMKDLGTVAGDYWSIAIGINDQGQIVGASANADFSIVRAFVRKNGKLVDLNSLIAGSTPLFWRLPARSIPAVKSTGSHSTRTLVTSTLIWQYQHREGHGAA